MVSSPHSRSESRSGSTCLHVLCGPLNPPSGVNDQVFGSVTGRRQVQSKPRLHPLTAEIGSSNPVTPTGIKEDIDGR